MVAQRVTLMLATWQRFPAHLVTRWTLTIAALLVARMFATALNVLALRLAGKLFVAGHFLAHVATPARFPYQLQTLTAFSGVTPLAATMHFALQELLTRITTRNNFL